MSNTIQWFDRLLGRIISRSESAKLALPGLADTVDDETIRALEDAEVLVISNDAAKRLIENGESPDDLKTSFNLPFDPVFVQFDAPVAITGEHGEGIRGILASGDGLVRVRAWFEERHAAVKPRYDFLLKEESSGSQKRISDLLYWLSGYISSSNVLAIRHNRRHDLIRLHRRSGRPVKSNYYTFAAVQEPKKRQPRQPTGAPKIRTADVHGHFRRAHWHTLPLGRGTAWYPTTWVRGYKRRIPEHEAVLTKAA